jgi:hypothetical protein
MNIGLDHRGVHAHAAALGQAVPVVILQKIAHSGRIAIELETVCS